MKEKIVKVFKSVKQWINQKKLKIGDSYTKICHWINYVRDYESNIEQEDIRDHQLIEKQEEIDSLNENIKNKNYIIGKLQEEADELKEKISKARTKHSETIKENNFQIDSLSMQLKVKDSLLIKETKKYLAAEKRLKEKEKERIAKDGTIASKNKKISNLEEEINDLKREHKIELAKKDYTINYLKTHMRSPNKEEILAYDFQFKEVERRQKNENRNEKQFK